MIVDYEDIKDSYAFSETNRKVLEDAERYINKYADDNNLSMRNLNDVKMIMKELMRYFGY